MVTVHVDDGCTLYVPRTGDTALPELLRATGISAVIACDRPPTFHFGPGMASRLWSIRPGSPGAQRPASEEDA
jgi:hypothetical protein